MERWSEILTIRHPRHPEVFLRWHEAKTNIVSSVQLGGIDTAGFMTEKRYQICDHVLKT